MALASPVHRGPTSEARHPYCIHGLSGWFLAQDPPRIIPNSFRSPRQVNPDGTVTSVEDQLVDTLGKVLGKTDGEWEKAGQ
eukprot:scaffold53659_cov31-Tisochrysis_lutea.AAC.5